MITHDFAPTSTPNIVISSFTRIAYRGYLLKVLIREGLLVIFLIAFLMYLNWKLSLFLFIAAPFIALVVGLAARRLRTISSRIQTAMGDVTHVASEAISGQKEVKSFGGKDYEINRFGKASENNKKQNIKLEATNYIASPLIQILVSLALALITWLALDSSVVTTMTAGTFVAFFGAAGMLAKPVKQLSEINSQIQKGLAAAEDIFEQIDSEPEIDEGNFSPDTVEGNINFNNVSFAYKNNPDKRVLNDISLTINKGETIAFVGKSGAGKTSLVNLLPRFYDNFEGTISVDGTSIKDYTLTNLRSQISIVSQDTTSGNWDYFLTVENGESGTNITVPEEFILNNPYPNPFNGAVMFSIYKLNNSPVNIDIINLNGRRIIRLHSGDLAPGNHTFTWNGIDDSRNKVASGVYYIKASGKLTEEWKPITYLK